MNLQTDGRLVGLFICEGAFPDVTDFCLLKCSFDQVFPLSDNALQTN